MGKRLPSEPPVLAGFTYVSPLGSGGFADVFLYAQEMPKRLVAVKVLLKDFIDDNVLRLFKREADTMAALSAHPSIVTIYEAGISADGRPFIVMEHCPGSYGNKYRRERTPAHEVLTLGIKIGSALETAHSANVLHRDIKPANILLTEFGSPVLSDFGIATAVTEKKTNEPLAMSVPWSAPEVVAEDVAGTVASDVWALGATLFSLLAGFSPFEMPGKGMNVREKLVKRIIRAKVTPIPNSDVPESLLAVLLKAMHKNPEKRFASALEMVEALQLVQRELALTVAPAEISTSGWKPLMQEEHPEQLSEPLLGQERYRVDAVSLRPPKELEPHGLVPDDGGIIEKNERKPLSSSARIAIVAGSIVIPIAILGVLVFIGVLP